MKVALTKPDGLKLTGINGETYIGGSQEWYKDSWHIASGCGPIAASNLIWFRTQPQGGQGQYIDLMSEMYTYLTPGMKGINTSALFMGGISRYGMEHSLNILPRALDIPNRPRRRPDIDMVRKFIISALNADAPVAFLNRSNGKVSNLENWHWVTIIAFDTDILHAQISDYGKVSELDISKWLRTSILGGAFVFLT